jgi:hypothetical protein
VVCGCRLLRGGTVSYILRLPTGLIWDWEAQIGSPMHSGHRPQKIPRFNCLHICLVSVCPYCLEGLVSVSKFLRSLPIRLAASAAPDHAAAGSINPPGSVEYPATGTHLTICLLPCKRAALVALQFCLQSLKFARMINCREYLQGA